MELIPCSLCGAEYDRRRRFCPRCGEARGTWLESHFDWQLRTFWWAALLLVALGTLMLVTAVTIVLIPIAVILFVAVLCVGFWAVYRIVRGWLALKDGRPVPG